MNSRTTDRFASILPIRKVAESWTLALVLLGLAGGVARADVPEIDLAPVPGIVTSDTIPLAGGLVNSDGMAPPITEFGVIYAVSEDIMDDESALVVTSSDPNVIIKPNLDDDPMVGFGASLDGLEPNTVYLIRFYATNSDGTGYSPDIDVRTLNNSAKLKLVAEDGLLIDGILVPPLGPAFAFDPDEDEYEVEAASLTEDITVTPKADDETGASIRVFINGVAHDVGNDPSGALASGDESKPLPLTGVGEDSVNVVEIVVTAEDPAFEETYTINVKRHDPLSLEDVDPPVSAISAGGATLHGKVDNDGKNEIIRRGFVYSVKSANGDPLVGGSGVTSVDVDGPHDPGDGIGEFEQILTGLIEGTTYAFKAFAQNVADDSKIVYSSVGEFTALPRLSSLSIEGIAPSAVVSNQGELAPSFATGTFVYSAAVSNLTGAAGLDAAEGKIQIKANRDQAVGTKIEVKVGSGAFEEVAPDSSSIDLPLAVGPNVITVQAIAQDGSTVQDYVIEVTRRAPLEIAPTTTLAGVTKTTATVGGDIVEDGGDAITVRGIVFSESLVNGAPELGGGGVTDVADPATTDGVFGGSLSLSEGVTYSARAYVVNEGGTKYSDVIFFTTQTDVPLPLNLIGTVPSRVILPGGEQRFNLNLASATLLSISASGAPNAEVSVYTSAGALVGTPAALALADVNLAAGSYYILVKHTDAGGVNETFELTLDARTPASANPRPDVAVGKSIRRLTGFSVFSPRKQVLPLTSRKSRAVKAVAAFSNKDFTPAKLTARASKTNKKFKVTYRRSGANVTGAITSGGFDLGDLRASDGLQRIDVQIKPKSKRKNARFSVALRAVSANARDKASIKLTVKK